jgi:Protein of unknown function (DUF3631)
VRRPLSTSNITSAALFRSIEAFQPTLIIDEADTFIVDDANSLREILNSGHEPDNAYVTRCVGESFEPRNFSTWAPIAIAKIGQLPTTLEDRSITILMRRRHRDEDVERFTNKDPAKFEILARKCLRWSCDNLDSPKMAEPYIPQGLDDRAADNWRPLFAIADAAGGDWPELARRAALKLSPIEDRQDRTPREMLLTDLRRLFSSSGKDRMASEHIREQLAEMEHRQWPEFKRGQPITPVQLATCSGRLILVQEHSR